LQKLSLFYHKDLDIEDLGTLNQGRRKQKLSKF
jgi:hypothetical protein